jgi:hypothetical protein
MNEPLYRKTFDAATLLREHPPQFRHQHKAELFQLAYPDGSASPGTIEVTRWAQRWEEQIQLGRTLEVEVRPDFFDYRPFGEAEPCLEWHVNFADPNLFYAYGSGLFAQDEMQVAEHPLLASVREAMIAQGLPAETRKGQESTPVLVRNVERRIEAATNVDAGAGRPAGLYGNRFAASPFEAIRGATRRIEPPTYSNIIAIAAPAGGHGEYSATDVRYVFATAYTGFRAAVEESARAAGGSCKTVVHSGFWGCGAFGGNRRLMVALQLLAARAAEVKRLVLHAGDAAGADETRQGLLVGDGLAGRCGPVCSVDDLVDRCVLLAYRWGFSDGN